MRYKRFTISLMRNKITGGKKNNERLVELETELFDNLLPTIASLMY